MKKNKKIVKRICCGLIAAGCLLLNVLPVLAVDGVSGSSDSYNLISYNCSRREPGVVSSNVFCRSAIMRQDNGPDHYAFGLLAVAKKDNGFKMQKSGWTETISPFNYGNYSNSADIKNKLASDFGWTQEELDCLDNYTFCYTNGGYQKGEESNIKIDTDKNFLMKYTNIVVTGTELLKDYLINDKFDLQDPYEDWTLPKFYLKTHNDNGLNKYTEYTLTWDTRDSFVENKESEYGFKVYIGTDNKPLNAKILDSTNLSPCLFTEKSFVFTWQDVKDLFSVLNTSKLENRFDIFIQVTHKDGSTIRALSNEYIHYLIVKRVEIRENNIVDKNGNEKSTYGKWENGQFKYTDGRDTSSEDNTTNSNGSSTAPGSNVSNDDYTDISNAPSSSQIDASATSSLIKTLDTIVSSVSNVPALLAKVYAWLPYQIITLIGTAIGLIVVVGIIKWVL